jgi:diguanylate cyclase (GGDEF)-like protein/PAS domain S-box-containing protein
VSVSLPRDTGLEREQGADDDVADMVGDPLDMQKRIFWTSHSRLGYLTLTAGSLFVLSYLAATPNGPHRLAASAVTSFTLVAALVTLVYVGRVSVHPWRVSFSLVSTLLAGFALTVCIWLDGGLDSPLVVLIALPVMSAALALPPMQVTICGCAALFELSLVAWTDAHVEAGASNIAGLSALVIGTAVLSSASALYRSRLEGDEDRLVEDLNHQASTDALTGCLSHGAFYNRLDIEIDRAVRHHEPLSLLVADVDLFKSFNDAHGHAAGDAALAEAGKNLRRASRSIDTVARVGGDEFAVILPKTDLVSASDLADRIVRSFTDGDARLRLSVGFAVLDPVEPTSQRLFRDADLGLYRAKADGRARTGTVGDVGTGAPAKPRGSQEMAGPVFAQADWDRLEESLRESNRATVEASSIIDSLESTASVGFGYVNRDFRLLRINSMLASVNGGKVEDQIGRKVAEVVPALWPTLEAIYQQVIDTGEAVVNQEVSGPTATDPDQIHSWLTNLNPVKVGGDVIGIAIVVIDITDRKQLEESHAILTRAVVSALSASVEMRDPYTAGHQERVARIAGAVACELHLAAQDIEEIELAARIHDIGKLSVPSELLSRPGRLSEPEMAVVRMHSQAGFDLLKRVRFPERVAQMVFQHHERCDGSGYPRGLRAEQILIGSRIIAVADVVESMATGRPYRAALGLNTAIDELQRGSGSIYDAGVVEAFMRVLESGVVTFEHGGPTDIANTESTVLANAAG